MIRYFRILALLMAYVLVNPDPATSQVEPRPAEADVVLGAGVGLSYLSTVHQGGDVGPEVKVHAELPLKDWIAAGVQAGFTYRREQECIVGSDGARRCGREGVFRPGVGLRFQTDVAGSEAALAVGLHGRQLWRYTEISYAIMVSRSEPFNVGVEALARASKFGLETGILVRFTPKLLGR